MDCVGRENAFIIDLFGALRYRKLTRALHAAGEKSLWAIGIHRNAVAMVTHEMCRWTNW